MIYYGASGGSFRLKGTGERKQVYYLRMKKTIFDPQKNLIEICSKFKIYISSMANMHGWSNRPVYIKKKEKKWITKL